MLKSVIVIVIILGVIRPLLFVRDKRTSFWGLFITKSTEQKICISLLLIFEFWWQPKHIAALAFAGSSLWLPWQSFLPSRKSIYSGLSFPSGQKHNIYPAEQSFIFKLMFLLYLIFESWGLILNVLLVKAEYKVFYWRTSVKHKKRCFE